jgi:hypothetical protein
MCEVNEARVLEELSKDISQTITPVHVPLVFELKNLTASEFSARKPFFQIKPASYRKKAAPVYHFSHLACKSPTKLDHGLWIPSHECAKEHCCGPYPPNSDQTDFIFEFRMKMLHQSTNCHTLDVNSFWNGNFHYSFSEPNRNRCDRIDIKIEFPAKSYYSSRWCLTRPNRRKGGFSKTRSNILSIIEICFM